MRSTNRQYSRHRKRLVCCLSAIYFFLPVFSTVLAEIYPVDENARRAAREYFRESSESYRAAPTNPCRFGISLTADLHVTYVSRSSPRNGFEESDQIRRIEDVHVESLYQIH